MRWRWMASLALLLLAAAAAPPGPCGPAANIGPIGQTEGTGALRDTDVPAFSATEEPCDSNATEPTAIQTMKPVNESGDVLHGLPSSDALRSIDQPRAAPVYR
nr:hypothetical protein [uncultured Rhodopila sp.]